MHFQLKYLFFQQKLKVSLLKVVLVASRNTGPNNQKFTLFTAAAVDLQQRVGQPQQQQQQLPRGQRFSYHENPANRFEHDFSSLPRDHRFLSWRQRDFGGGGGPVQTLRPPPARRADIEGHDTVRGHRRSFHYDDRKEYYSKRDLEVSPGVARRSFDPTKYEQPCDRYVIQDVQSRNMEIVFDITSAHGN